jgi:hypothetical protein
MNIKTQGSRIKTMPFVDPTNTWRVRSSKTIPTPEQTPTTLPYIILDAKLQKEGVAS